MGRNSTLQPISEFGGGGLNLIVCQLVDCRFCKKFYLRIVSFFVTLLGFLISSQESCNTLPQSGQTHFHHPSEFSPQRQRVDLE